MALPERRLPISAQVSDWNLVRNRGLLSNPFPVGFLVISGGGGGRQGVGGAGGYDGGGGNATGYRTSTGGLGYLGAAAESGLRLNVGDLYTVTVGGGGTGAAGTGSNSVFHTITSNGSTGGATAPVGGAGAGAAGSGLNGGNGLANTITGTSVTRTGGGGGSTTVQGAGGSGGGGAGRDNANGISGTVNTGSGGGGTRSPVVGTGGLSGGLGGSGVVILQYPAFKSIIIGAGLTGTTAFVGSNKVTTFTAGTGNVSFI
jgi:hypothetical protein